ncbi:MAG TPA: CocE/NonD family hydrolase [Rhodanobacteraceae bacterium]|nr:CocE/NonD family hydrolase [Rhodanobacteraceae bacterium]
MIRTFLVRTMAITAILAIGTPQSAGASAVSSSRAGLTPPNRSVSPHKARQPNLQLPAGVTVETAAPAMARLAKSLLENYHTASREIPLEDRFRVQLVAGKPLKAETSIAALRRQLIQRHAMQSNARNLQFAILAKARIMGPLTQQSFDAAFDKVVNPLDDRTAAMVVREIEVNPIYSSFTGDFADALKAAKSKPGLSAPETLALVRAWQLYDAYRIFAKYAGPAVKASDARRYIIKNVQVKSDDASISVMVVRPRNARGKLPALLNFTIYADLESTLNEARRTAANGYIGVEGFTRGKLYSPDKPVAYEDDGKDADAVIDWIARQPWSDGRVGMYGGSYEGFTQWAAAKHLPKALKALMPSVSAAPGIGVPMEGNVFQTFVYYWPLYTLSGKTLDNKMLTDRARWFRMELRWYANGKAYRDLPKIDGTPNPTFEHWLDHPSYDAYWQSMIPYRNEFANIDIPVLTTTGYFDDGQIGALYYYRQLHKHAPKAESYLVTGPYDHVSGQRGTLTQLGEPRDTVDGYRIDPVARIDLGTLRYAWFNYVFKHGPKPAILKNRVNFEVMGANKWRHVSSIAAMSNSRKRFYLTPSGQGGRHGLSALPQPAATTTLTVNLAERKKQDPFNEFGQIVTHGVDHWNGLVFVSAPFNKDVQFNGLFRGDLDVVANKKDFDFAIDLYEKRPDGSYFHLSHYSQYMARASYVEDRTTRHLLTPGAHTHLVFTSGRMTSLEIRKGSRLVMVLSVIKIPFAEINYGTGGKVSDETIADAGAPLRLQWYGDSSITVPLWQ